MRQRTIVAFAVIVLSGCATPLQEEGAEAVVPFSRTPTGQIVVQTLVNGQGPFDFAVDTGASISVAFEKLCDRAVLPRASDTQRTIRGLVASGRFPIISLAFIAPTF